MSSTNMNNQWSAVVSETNGATAKIKVGFGFWRIDFL